MKIGQILQVVIEMIMILSTIYCISLRNSLELFVDLFTFSLLVTVSPLSFISTVICFDVFSNKL